MNFISTFFVEQTENVKMGYIDEKNIDRIRCVGFVPKFEDAELLILDNCGNIWEDGWYTYAVITTIEGCGLYPLELKRTFYKWQYDKWVKTEFDDPCVQCSNFYTGIG